MDYLNFKEWMLSEAYKGLGLSQYAKNGKLNLYHFSSIPKENAPKKIILHPKFFGQNETITRGDIKASKIPRIFFYVDLEEKEGWFDQSVHPLYKVKVDYSQVYDLETDPDKIKEKIRKANGGILNVTSLMYALKKRPENGFFYHNESFGQVNWFNPIEVELVEEKRKK